MRWLILCSSSLELHKNVRGVSITSASSSLFRVVSTSCTFAARDDGESSLQIMYSGIREAIYQQVSTPQLVVVDISEAGVRYCIWYTFDLCVLFSKLS